MTGVKEWLARIPQAIRGTGRLRCSFCRRPAAEVDRLVAGASAYICDTCIERCVAVIEAHGGSRPRAPNH
jgi:ATP-dependent Clp protease ATP-binding subunit ClpX